MTAAEPSLHVDRPARVLLIVAHPDDADFGPAGTIATWVAAGTVAHLVCCTSGDAGAEDPETDPLALARLREAEQREAARIIGYQGVTFLHRADGALENDLPLREQLVTVIRTFRPDAVMTMDPTVVFSALGRVQHTDHRAAAMAAVDAVYPAARNAMAFPQLARGGLEPHVVGRLYLYFTDLPNAWVDTTAALERKLEALRAHASQLREPEAIEARVRDRELAAGARVGVIAAEAFRVLDIG